MNELLPIKPARKLAQVVSGCHAFNNNQDVADTAE
ncbi:unnamed protein product, partial [marine sediment metagenome]